MERMELTQLRVTRMEKVALDAVLVSLEAVSTGILPYQAGQFITFILDRYGKSIRRSYSLVTTPGIDAGMAIVIKRRINGEISRYLMDNLRVGDILDALPPAGRFTIQTDASNQNTFFFIAAGSGISPLFSLLKKVLHEEVYSRVILIYQNHQEASIIFRTELLSLQQRFADRFIWINLLSNPLSIAIAPQRLNNFLLEQLVLQHQRSEHQHSFYLCGPGSFMRMAHFVLKLMGYADEQIRKENFVIDSVPPPPEPVDKTPKKITLTWKGTRFHFTATYPENILQAALNHHIHLPYSCRGGRCSTCIMKSLSGKVTMTNNEVLTARELDQGLILTCVGYAETDLELEK